MRLRRVRTTNKLEYEIRGRVADYRNGDQHKTASVDRYIQQLPVFQYQIAVNPRVVLRAQ